MKRKLLSLVALIGLGGSVAAWGYAQDGTSQPSSPAGSRYAEPQRFQPPASGSLTGQLQSANQAVVADHGGSDSANGTIQQTAGLDWLLQRGSRKPSSAQGEQAEAMPQPTSSPAAASQPKPLTAQPAPAASSRGPAPVAVDFNAAKSYGQSSRPSSTANGTTTTQFRPIQARQLDPPAEPRVASRPLPSSEPAPQPEAEPAQLAAPQPVEPQPMAQPAAAKPAVEFNAPSLSDQAAPSSSTAEAGPIMTVVSPQLGLAVIGPQAVVLGRETEYVVHLENGGSTSARSIQVSIALPTWVSLTGLEANTGVARAGEQAAGTLVWTINDLAAETATQLTLQLAATEARPVTLDVAYTAAPTTVAASIAVQQPKLEVALNGPSEIPYGEARTFTLSINNPGTGDAENVVLQLQPLSRSMEAGVTRDLGTLKAGQRKAIEIELTAEEAGMLAVQAAVSAAGGLRAETKLNVQVRRAELAIEVAGPPQKFAGAEAIYQMKISNKGDAIANDVLLAAVLPEGAEVLDATEGSSQEAGNLGWNVGSLAPGDARIYQVICSLTKSGENVVEVRAKSGTDMAAGKAIRTMVEAIADLKLLVNDPKGPIAVGKEANYEIRIINRGSKAAENVLVKGYFSEGIEPESVDGALGKLEVGQAIFDPIARIEAGEEMVLKIKARATAGGNHIFRAVVECEKPETRLVSEETTRYFDTTANAFGDSMQR